MPPDPGNSEFAVVGFVDLLGMGPEIERIQSYATLVPTYEAIKSLQSTLLHSPRGKVDESMRSDYEIRSAAFTDCMAFAMPIRSQAVQSLGFFDGVLSALHLWALGLFKLVVAGHLLRGALDIGFWFQEGDIVISPAQVRAFQLERRLGAPVIAVTQKLWNALADNPSRRNYAPESDPLTALIRQGWYGDLSFRFLDYLYNYVESVDWESPAAHAELESVSDREEREAIRSKHQAVNVRQAFLGHKSAICSRESATSPSDQAKLKWLADYHNEVAAEWLPDDGEIRIDVGAR